MARTSNITFAQVAQIADTMKAAGTRPTARAVRERIGSGSMGTIHKLLQQWAGKAAPDDEDGEGPELPSSIASALMDFVSTQVAEACEPMATEIENVKAGAEQLAEENERLENVIERLETERDDAQRQQAISASLHRREMNERETDLAELKGLREIVAELRRELDRSQRQTEMCASFQPELVAAKIALAECEKLRNEAERNAAVFSAQLEAKTEKANELEARLKTVESIAAAKDTELRQANNHYQACAARLEAAALEIEGLRAKAPRPAPKTKTHE